MPEICALVAAAGKGTRAGLPYPKTLFPVHGSPILIRILDLLSPYDRTPTVVVSPSGLGPIKDCLDSHGRQAHLVVQPEARGMGDAVLKFAQSPAAAGCRHLVLIWGDVPLIHPDTLSELVAAHLEAGNTFTFATRHVDAAYTVVSRTRDGAVESIQETREAGLSGMQPGERDIGLFVFECQPVLDALREDVPGKYGKTTGEHGFLYIVGQLVRNGFRVQALPIAREQDLVSLNSLSDLDGHI